MTFWFCVVLGLPDAQSVVSAVRFWYACRRLIACGEMPLVDPPPALAYCEHPAGAVLTMACAAAAVDGPYLPSAVRPTACWNA